MESDNVRLASQVVIQLEPLDPSLIATLASNYSRSELVETDAGEETEGLVSDDTGFYSAVEDLTSQDEGEDQEEERLEREVDRNYPVLVEKYCGLKHKAGGMKDPFNEVDFTELCMVLKMSAEKSGLLKAAELLDVALQIFFRQVSVCHRSVVTLAEELQKRGRRLGPGSVEQNGGSQGRTENDGFQGQQEAQARQRRAVMIRTGEKRGKWIDGEQAEYSFVKEQSEQFVMRRMRMHECMETIAQNMYLDFEVDLGEFYKEGMGMMEEVEGDRQNQSASQLIRDMGRYANVRTMGDLYLPGGELYGGNGEEEANMEGMEADAENLEPDLPLPPLQSEEEDGSTDLSAGDDLVVEVMEVEGEGGENVPPKEKGKKGSKKNRKRRRVPFGEHQNIGEEEGQQGGEKRTRLEGEEDGGDGATREGVGEEASDGNAVHEQSTFLINEDDFENWTGGELDLTLGEADNYDRIFRPPSPLSGKDWSLFNFDFKRHTYDMQAIKSQFNEIVNSSLPEKGDITFVEILEKCEMEVLARSDQCIFHNPHKDKNSSSATATATKEISVGVAFLAMLHNAASEGFYMTEDPEGAFKVSREIPGEEEWEID